MSLQATGKLIVAGATEQVSDKFKKREFVIAMEESVNGNTYTNYGKFQLVQAKCDILDRYSLGSEITVSFNIRGNSYQDKRDGQTKYITNLDAWRIEYAGQQGQAAPAPQAQSQFTPGQNGGYTPPQQHAPSPHDIDDLPF